MAGGAIIPERTPATHRIHLDTCYVRPVLLDWDKDKDVKDAARELIFGQASGSLAVSMVSLGEVMTTAARDAPRGLEAVKDPLTRLQELEVEGRIAICGPGHARPDSGFLSCVNQLHTDDERLDPIDVLIVSAALCCQDCDQFYTNDSVLLNSTTIRKAAELRGVKIVNPA